MRQATFPVLRIAPPEDKVAPQAPEVEQAVLGAIMLHPKSIGKVADFLERDHFYVKVHAIVYGAMLHLNSSAREINLLTLVERLKATGELDIAGGAFYISELSQKATGSIQVNARIILQKYIRRQLIVTCSDTLNRAYDDKVDEFDLVDEHNEGIGKINAITANSDPVTASEIIGQMIDNHEQPLYIHFGMNDLDRHVAMGPGCVTVVGARPAVGKTTFVLNGLMNMARAGHKSLFLSLEMSAEQLVAKISSSLTGIDSERITRNEIDGDERERIAKAAAEHGAWIPRIMVSDLASLKASQVFGLFERAVKRHDCKVVVIDYLQLMDGEGDNGAERMANISKTCKQAAKASKIRLIEVSQLKRRDGADTDPQMSDLRESGQIEADGDIIILLGRPMGGTEILAKAVKNKIGPIGNVTIPFDLLSQKVGVEPPKHYDPRAGLSTPDNRTEGNY